MPESPLIPVDSLTACLSFFFKSIFGWYLINQCGCRKHFFLTLKKQTNAKSLRENSSVIVITFKLDQMSLLFPVGVC